MQKSKYKFYMARCVENDAGVESVGSFVDLEANFDGLRYKQMTGLNGIGEPSFYSESYADENKDMVYIPKDSIFKTSSFALTLYFFGDEGLPTDQDKYAYAQNALHNFLAFITGCKIVWYDTARKRKVKMYLSFAASPKTDRLYGLPYMEVEFKFTNVYDRSFELSDSVFNPVNV